MKEEPNTPSMAAYGRHAFICINGNCAASELGEQLQKQFMALNRVHNLNKLRNPERVKCTLSDCLGVCSHGPILTVYPDGIWYHNVDEMALERIYREHILGGHPVEDFIFHRLYPAGQEPGYAPVLRGDEKFDVETIKTANDQNSVTKAASNTEVDAEMIRKKARRLNKKKGLVIVNTGEGKGKTTASLGVMTRAWGRKMKVGVIQFLKNENARFGEIRAAEKMGIDWISTGDGWTWTSGDMDETQARAQRAWQVAQEKIVQGGYDLFILDEFTYAMHFGWIDTNQVVQWLSENKPPMLHLIITGRYAPDALIEFADLVTEMKEIKHPLRDQNIRAQPGIEF
ncbi:MAG: cob(I)yrinic acid a,c-diamide adenosyltransferase [Chloroflexota bacterium]